MKKRTVGTAYFSTNLSLKELKDDFGDKLICHIDILKYPLADSEREPLVVAMKTCEYFNCVLVGLKLHHGITENSIIGNRCGELKQLKIKRRRITCHDGRVVLEKNNVFKCNIYSKKI